MAAPIPTPCTSPGCPDHATRQGRCPDHQRTPWAHTATRESRGYDHRWRKVRDTYRAKHPTCEANECSEPTRDVDHVIPLALNGARLDTRNLRALCGAHHDAKTKRDRLLAVQISRAAHPGPSSPTPAR